MLMVVVKDWVQIVGLSLKSIMIVINVHRVRMNRCANKMSNTKRTEVTGKIPTNWRQ